MSERVFQLLQLLEHEKHRTEKWDMSFVPLLTVEELRFFWQALLERVIALDQDPSRLHALLREWLLAVQRQSPLVRWDDEVVALVERLYRSLHHHAGPAARLLALLLHCGNVTGWQQFSDLMASQPPQDTTAAVEALTPLWKLKNADFSVLYPRLLDAVEHPAVAALVLDLTNFLVRQGKLKPHPATLRSQQLISLLGAIIDRLEQFEQRSRERGVGDLREARQVAESIALAVSLCDCLTLIQAREAIGKLYRMLELGHRRLRIEAAAALARFGEDVGAKALVEMAEEPSVRLRVHAYAAELGLLDQVPREYRTDEALAEAQLVVRLSEPEFFGVAPSHTELLEARTLYWPGYEEAQRCFLFRYTYPLPNGELHNIGITGPLVHAVAADLTHLMPDDIYALYAGWHAEHEDLGQIQLDPNLPAQVREVESMCRQLEHAGFTHLEPALIGRFFGERLLVAKARRNGQPGSAICRSGQEAQWISQGNPDRPLEPDWAFHWYVGRDLLHSFNDNF
jgi:hypothetical protein